MINYETLKKKIDEIEGVIDYTFENKDYLLLAMTHSSYANEYKNENLSSNERIEFLGDAILNIVISEFIFMRYPEMSEGQMTRLRANVVCEPSLMRCASNIDLGDYLLLGKGEELTGGRRRASILSDAFEALIGAIYLDGGIKNARVFIFWHMKQLVEDSAGGMLFMDYKTQLQEIIQKNSDKKVSYEVIEEKGPDHKKLFVSQVKVADKVLGIGEGRSKKESEQNAAKAALRSVGGTNE